MTVDNVHALFEPDPEAIRNHLERLFRRARDLYPDGLQEIAYTDRYGVPNLAQLFDITPEGLDRAAEFAVSVNKVGRNVYVGANPRKPGAHFGRRASASDVEWAILNFADVDKPAGIPKLRQAPLPYTWAVTTGRQPHRRVHPYWERQEPTTDMREWSAMQAALRDAFAGDNITNPDRIMRLGGSVSYPLTSKKQRDGYQIEKTSLRTVYDGDERDPVSIETLRAVYQQPGTRETEATGQETPQQDNLSANRPSEPNWGNKKSIKDRLAAIIAGDHWHDNTRDLVAQMVNRGDPDALILALAPTLTLHGFTVVQTHADLSRMLTSARTKWAIPNNDDEFQTTADVNSLALRPIGILTPSARQPRQWLVPYRMMRRHVTMTTAAPGVGKSTLVIEEAVSMASGIDFLGFGIKEPTRIAIINNEETQDEIERRIEATCLYFEVDPTLIATGLFVYSGVDAEKIILARTDRNGNVFPTIHTASLRELVNDLSLDAVVLDPFVQLHYVEESSNEQISHALVQMRSLGTGTRSAAIHLVHHNRKPAGGNSHQAGDISSARGASSMGGEAHFFFTLTDMGPQDGEKLNIPEDDRINYLRLDDAKRKMAPAQGARWFERHGIIMPYGLMGEEIGVLIPKEMEDIENKVTADAAIIILQMIDEAWTAGIPYSDSPRATDRYIVNAIMKRFLNFTKEATKSLIKAWDRNGMIATDLNDRHAKLRGLRVLKWPG